MPARVRSERTSLSNCANAASTPSISLPVDVSSIGSVADRSEMPGDFRCARRAMCASPSDARLRRDTGDMLVSQMNVWQTHFGTQQESEPLAKRDVQQGTLALIVLKTLEVLGPLHGYGIARRIEQISGDLLAVNQGTLYPVLLKLEQEGAVASEWGTSANNRRARFYRLTAAGRRRLRVETQEWAQTTALMDRFIAAKVEDLA
jgi:transcriptional regulator